MIDESCKVPREDLDDGFNPCRRQVVENGELCQYAHMYDVMNERYDREEDTSYLNSVKRDRINQSTPSQSVGGGKLYAQDGKGAEGFINSSGVLDPTTHTEIPSSKAVADYVSSRYIPVNSTLIPPDSDLNKYKTSGNYAVESNTVVSSIINKPVNLTKAFNVYVFPVLNSDYYIGQQLSTFDGAATYYRYYDGGSRQWKEWTLLYPSRTVPNPLPVDQGGTGGNTPYVTDAFDNSANFVVYDEQNARYNAAPMSALKNYLATQFMSFDNESIPEGADLNTYQKPGNYSVRLTSTVPTIVNKPNNASRAFNLYVVPILSSSNYVAQYLVEYEGGSTYYRYFSALNQKWTSWRLLYPTPSSTIPNPLPVDQGGTGAQTAAAALTSLGVPQEISNAFAAHTATTVADNNLLPTNALMIDYVAAHTMATPPDKFSYAVSPFPTGTWEGEMNVNVVPVFSVTIGAVEYIIARVYGSKKFNYTGTADNINLFSSLKPVGDYTSIFSGSTDIPLTLSVSGRSYTAGTYGLTPNVSGSNLSLNNQIVSSVFNLGGFNISTNLKCVFGEGTNTPGVTVSVNCMALMWHSVS